jgi:hypothetical protein
MGDGALKICATFIFLAITVSAVCASGRNDAGKAAKEAPDKKSEAMVIMGYQQPHSNPQLNSFLPLKLSASGRPAGRILYTTGVAEGGLQYLLVDGDLAVVDCGDIFYVVDIARKRCLGSRAKSPNSFAALDGRGGFYFAAENQLVHAGPSNFNDEDIPDYFVPGLGQYSTLVALMPSDDNFVAAVQDHGNPKYPEESLSLFQKPYPALSVDWEQEFTGVAVPPPISPAGEIVVALPNKLTVIGSDGGKRAGLEDEFAPVSCSVGPDGLIYLFCHTAAGPRLRVYDMKLETKWEAMTDRESTSQPPIVGPDSPIYLLGGGSVAAYRDGRLLWELPASEGAAAILAGNGMLAVADGARLSCIDSSGAVAWEYRDDSGESFVTPPVIDTEGRILVASDKAITIIE